MTVFVTVGSTSFDNLIETVCSSEVLQLFAEKGLKKVILQLGRGRDTPAVVSHPEVKVEWYRYKDSIQEDMRAASLVIGHGGAGTILESLIEHKPLIVVLNEDLMDNHQNELAEQMAKEGYLMYCTCSNLVETLKSYFNSSSLVTFASEPNMFPAFLEECMGYR